MVPLAGMLLSLFLFLVDQAPPWLEEVLFISYRGP